MLNHYTTKMTGPLETWITHLSFLCFCTVIQGVYSFLYCQNPYFHMKCLFTKIQSNIAIWQYIAIHSNAIRNMASTHIVSPLMHSYTSTDIITISNCCTLCYSSILTCSVIARLRPTILPTINFSLPRPCHQ